MNLNEMTGLELMQAMIDGHLPVPSISKTIPMELTIVEKGRCVFEATADENHLNPMGGVHGGFAAVVMDSVTGCAVHTMLDAGIGYGTVDLNVKMCRPVPVNTLLYGEGKVINMSKSLGISEGMLKDASGKLFAHATATMKLFPL